MRYLFRALLIVYENRIELPNTSHYLSLSAQALLSARKKRAGKLCDPMCHSFFHNPRQYGGVEVTFLASRWGCADRIRVVSRGKITCVDRINFLMHSASRVGPSLCGSYHLPSVQANDLRFS